MPPLQGTVMLYQSEEQAKITRKVLEFAGILKEADVAISPVETMDMMTALRHIDFDDRPAFKQALSSTLVKDYTDLPVFERCFREFFDRKSGGKDTMDPLAVEDMLGRQRLREALQLSPGELDELNGLIDRYIDGLPGDTRASLSDQDILDMMLNDPVLASSSGALGMALSYARSRSAARGGGTGEDGEDDADPSSALRARIRMRLRDRGIGSAIKKREQYLLHKYIYQLKPAEVQEMRELIKRFGQKLKNRISLRKKRMKRGSLDVKRVFRFNLKYGGIPFRLYYRNRKIDRPQLVVLCDISSSVNQYSRFMLLLTYTLQGLFSKVRTFAFISNVVEITPVFMEMNPETALNSIFTDTDFTYGFGSNYGRCFNQFLKDFSDSLTRKTTVLILGDGRNNYQDEGLDSFIRIGERCRNLFWLNPDRRHLWGWGDSAAPVYLPHCTEMKEVNNFLDLSEFIDRLFLNQR
jgi:uncharacterized protein with von Willebrand factor type A (vWA) domain